MSADPDALASLITASEAATLANVAVNTICTWVQRGYLTTDGVRTYLEVAGHNDRGKPLYRYLDVARAELATRRRARRTFPAAA